jgi:uncharacterized membrane protein
VPSLRTEGHGRLELELSSAVIKALSLGVVAGLRSMTPPALLARSINRGDLPLSGTPFAVVGRLSPLLQVLMVGEMVADKAPFAPSRNLAPSLIFRTLSGALVGAAIFASEGQRAAEGAPLGAVAAVLGSAYGERLRVQGRRKLGVPNVVLGHLEDGMALLTGTRLLQR